ncbi:MAG: helix-turn-helix transcriptional regulator [Paeniclostridium sp.]|nr:helix-turn-helix transcriptional regulator [Paeniclostridium sp.]MBW4863037.1 helix-turn-helix transcriptional regulator [Paeniclostridium sp.]
MNKGTVIKKLREENKLTQAYIARKIGLSERHYRRIEKGEVKKIDFRIIDILSREFKLSYEDIIKDLI